MIEAYPLAWPQGWKRTAPAQRRRANFNTSSWTGAPGGADNYRRKRDLTVTDGTNRILAELSRLNIDRQDVVISTNVRLRLDGLPRSGEREPEDPGVAVYWTERRSSGAPRCMAIDRYDRVADNLAAVAATIEAMRAIERHGGAEILNRAFTGFTALPAPVTGMRPWRDVLGFPVDSQPAYSEVEDAYRRARSTSHPDKGGSHEAFMAVQSAFDQAHAELHG